MWCLSYSQTYLRMLLCPNDRKEDREKSIWKYDNNNLLRCCYISLAIYVFIDIIIVMEKLTIKIKYTLTLYSLIRSKCPSFHSPIYILLCPTGASLQVQEIYLPYHS